MSMTLDEYLPNIRTWTDQIKSNPAYDVIKRISKYVTDQKTPDGSKAFVVLVKTVIDKIMREVNPSDFSVALDAMSKSIESFDHAFVGGVRSIKNELVETKILLDNYLTNAKDEYATYFAIRCVKVDGAFESLSQQLLDFENAIRFGSITPKSAEQSMVIKFNGEPDALLLSFKLVALTGIYRLICDLLEASLDEFPLKISEAKGGSLKVEVVGLETAINIVRDVIKETAKFLYRRFTREGKLEAEIELQPALETAINIREKLVNAGIPTDAIDQKLEALAGKHLSNLLLLTRGEESIQVDGEVISLEIEIREQRIDVGKYIEQSKEAIDEPNIEQLKIEKKPAKAKSRQFDISNDD